MKTPIPALRRLCLGAVMFVFCMPMNAGATETIQANDIETLKLVLEQAQQLTEDTTHISLLPGNYFFDATDELPEIRTAVRIDTQAWGATFLPQNGGPATLFSIAPSGSLSLHGVEFRNFSPAVVDANEPANSQGLILNQGWLFLNRVEFEKNRAIDLCGPGGCSAFKPLVNNLGSGELFWEKVSVVNSGISQQDTQENLAGAVITNSGEAVIEASQVYFGDVRYEPPIANSGNMRFTHFSVKSEKTIRSRDANWIESGGSLQVGNSLFSGFASQWCDHAVSDGYNIVENADCSLSGSEDIVGRPASIHWLPVDSDWNGSQVQILTHALVPIAASLAVDTGGEVLCEGWRTSLHSRIGPTDANGDGVIACDRGAVELEKKILGIGSINGLYFNPEIDGHYVYVADTKNNTMVMWTTFNSRGEQVWIFGIADKLVAGRSMIADAYINRNGSVSLTGEFDAATSMRWGQLELDLSDCDTGTLFYHSDIPGFGAGTFELTRLANIRRVGCENQSVSR